MSRRPLSDSSPSLDVEGLGLTHLKLEDLVDREALREMATSFVELFGVPMHVFSASGTLLAEAGPQASICAYLNEHRGGRTACSETVTSVKRLAMRSEAAAYHPCFTGATYRVLPIEYDGRRLGRIILGPYLTARPEGVPRTLLDAEPGLESRRAADLLPEMVTVAPEMLARVSDHLTSVLDLILFSGHKALLTSKMHLASIRESYRDLSEKNDRLEEALERLKELDRLKSNFLATMSHELRTPLTSIMGYGEMLAEGIGGPLTGEQAEFVQTIRTKSDQLLGLIMNLLDLSKLESGTAIMRQSNVVVRTLLDDAAATLAPAAGKKGVRLEVDCPDDLPNILGDPDRLRQVFVNLTENATKFTAVGGKVVLSAHVLSGAEAGEPGYALLAPVRQAIEVRVTDTGVGIPESERARVFDPFYQIDQSSTREFGGTGLGLAIVKRLVDAHDGSIRVESNAPRGAVFVVTLPVARSGGSLVPVASAPPPPRLQTGSE